MASHNHEVLKIKALEWLYQVAKCRYVTTELKIGKYIYDVIGSDGSRIFIIEAKSEHYDFLRDCNRPEDIKRELLELKDTLQKDSDLKKYKEESDKIREKSIKFYDASIFKISTCRYIISPTLMIDEDELPANWGLLDEEPKTVVKCERNKIDNKRYIDKIIREICRKNTKNFLGSLGVEFGKKINFPNVSLTM